MGIYFIVGGHYSSVARPPSFRPPMDNVAMQLKKCKFDMVVIVSTAKSSVIVETFFG